MLPRPDFPKALGLSGEPLRLLLIEDDPIMVEIVGSYLGRISFTQCALHSTPTLTEGLALLARLEIDLVISDLHLPDSAGEATINALVSAVGCPVIAITSDLHPALRAATLSCGAYDFLHKSDLSEAALSRLVRLAAMQARTFRSLRKSESRLRAIMNNEPQCVKLLDSEGRLIEMNPAGLRMIEADSMDAMRGQCVYGLVVDEHRAAFRDLTRRVARGEQGSLEFEMTGLRGGRRWLETRAVPLRDDVTAKQLVLCITRDITERRQAEAALRESEARFRALTELSSDWYWEQDAELRFVRTAGASPARGGISAEVHVGLRRWELPRTEIVGQSWDEHRKVLDARQPFHELLLRRTSEKGDVRYVSVDGRPIFDAGGSFTGYCGVAKDVTGRIASELALRDSEERFRHLTQLSSDFYWESDARHRMTRMAHGSGTAPLGSEGPQLGKTRWQVPSTRPDDAGWAAHRAMLDARLPFRDFEVARMSAQGEERHFAISGEPVFEAAGTFVGYRGTGREITARKREEAILALEHAVTRCLADAHTAATGLRSVLRTICESQGWPLGRYFEADEAAGLLRFSEAWGKPLLKVEAMIDRSRAMVYARGQGLSGTVWQSGEPLWVRDVSKDRRTTGATRGTLQGGAFVFPITSGGRTIGVMSFSSADERHPDERLLRAIGVIGSQVGQFLMRKKAEHEERRRAEDLGRFRAALDASADPVLLVDARTGAYVDFNEAACHTYGYSRDELLGMSVDQIRVDRSREQLLADYGRLCADPDSDQMEIAACRRKDGSVLPIEFTRRLVRTGDGPIIVATARDLTERLRAEARQAAVLKYQERVARFGQLALAQRQPAELIERAVQAVLEALGAEAVAYVEPEPGAAALVVRALVGVADANTQPATAPCPPGSPLGDAMHTGARAVVDGAGLPFPWAQELRSTVLLPVRGDNGVRGMVCAGFKDPNAFAAEELNFAEAAASVLSAALQRIESENRLAYLAQFDPLTGLANRTLLADRFSQMIAQARRHGTPLAVLFIDLDSFKTVNDTLGHAGGDELLKEVALRLQATVREGDTVARISGDEFAIVLADMAQLEDAALVAQKVIDGLAATVDVSGKEVFVTASVGIAVFPSDGADADTLIDAADAAMYRAKESGRNTFEFFTADISQRSRARAHMSAELRRALEREEFALVYQPKIDLATREATGAEALLRWKHPARGLVSPAEFIPVLEETGLIVPVGDWVLRRACADLKAWQAAGLSVGPVAVNLSARQFRRGDLDSHIKALVAGVGVQPDLIELEITESQLMHDPDHAIRMMRALRDAGMRIAIDDFGTGYSSLAYLHRFPVSALKIDRSFVKDMTKGKDGATIVRTIIELAHSLAFTVVAEGVETEEQANALGLLRCEYAQGFLFAKPMPAEDYAKLLPKR